MSRKRAVLLLVLLLAAGAGTYAYRRMGTPALVLTGIVTTNDVIVSPQIAGQIGQLLVTEGDTVKKDQLVAVIVPDELKAETAYFAQNVQGMSSQIRESEAALRLQERQTVDQIRQAESTLASIEAQAEAAAADVEQARVTYTRTQNLSRQNVVSAQELDAARTAQTAAQGKLDALKKQVEAQRATVAIARSNAEQISVRRSQPSPMRLVMRAVRPGLAMATQRRGVTPLVTLRNLSGSISAKSRKTCSRNSRLCNSATPLTA